MDGRDRIGLDGPSGRLIGTWTVSNHSVGRVGAAPSSLEATLREAWHRARAVEAVRPDLAGLVAPRAGANEDTVGFAKRGVVYSLGS